MVLARFVASLLTACVMGWLWLRLGRTAGCALRLGRLARPIGERAAFWDVVRHDVMHAGGFLVIGAFAAATLKRDRAAELAGSTVAANPVVSVLALAMLGGAAVDLLRGRRVRGGVADPVLAHRPAGVPGRRTDGRPEAVRHAGRHVRAAGSRCGSRPPPSWPRSAVAVAVGAVLL